MKRIVFQNRISKSRECLGVLLVVGLAIFALVSSFDHLNLQKYLTRAERNGVWLESSVSRFGEQLACLDDVLSPDQTVGFVAALSPTQNTEYYQLTQYFMAPILVARSARHSLVIGYAPQPGDLDLILQSYPGLKIVKNCENGVVLFAGEP